MSAVLITKQYLKAVVQRLLDMIENLVSKNSDAELNSVAFPDGPQLSSYVEEGEAEGDSVSVLTLGLSDEAEPFRADFEVPGNIRTAGILPGALMNNDGDVHVLPGDDGNLPEVGDGNYGGIILSTRFRSFEVVSKSVSTTVDQERVECFPNRYNRLSVNSIGADCFRVALVGVRSLTFCDEFWVELDMTALDADSYSSTQTLVMFVAEKQGDAISGSVMLSWVNGMPRWYRLIGKRVLVHVINSIATWNVIGANESPSPTPTPTPSVEPLSIIGSGPFEDAMEAVDLNSGQCFQWMLIDTDNFGNTVQKPIWHIGNYIFIDAIGSVISNDDSTTNPNPESQS